MLRAESLVKEYPTGENAKLVVLNGVDLDIQEGEFVALVGESGTGKSTLLHLLGGLDRPTSGAVFFRNKRLDTLKDETLADFRNRHLGFVFQFHHLLPEFSAWENVAMPAILQGKSPKSTKTRAGELLELVGLSARMHHRPNQLSGGEQQRVAVVRALMNAPELVLMDEPTGNLDTATAELLHDEIVRLRDTEGRAFVTVTHNPSLAVRADRILRVQDGRVFPEPHPAVNEA
jgi:lipoprotein-releasing system ATP-binding protein